MLTTSVLDTLPQEWQYWIHQNLERACSPASMEQVMVRDGRFDVRQARAAIEEMRREHFPHLRGMQAMPALDESRSRVQTIDREVNVLFALKTPRIVVLGDFLSDGECDALTEYGSARLERSPVVADNPSGVGIHANRTSRGAMLQRAETEMVARIEARIASLIGWPVANGEGLQILRYEPGNEYRPHHDWFDPTQPGGRKHLERGGQRVASFIMYLSDVEQGGATVFPHLGLQVQPHKCGALYFENTDAWLTPNPHTLHAGDPVIQGVKTIATKWLRASAHE